MSISYKTSLSVLAAVLLSCRAMALPPDVPANFWAARAIKQTTANGILHPLSDGLFHGKQTVHSQELAIALARLAQSLKNGSWAAEASQPLPDSIMHEQKLGDWQAKPVTRYMLAEVLARMGNYCWHGITRAPKTAKDTGKSIVVPPTPRISVPHASPAWAALHYLANAHMIAPGSCLLLQGNPVINGAQMSRALADMVNGLNNQITSLGLDANGNTPDASFHKKKH